MKGIAAFFALAVFAFPALAQTTGDAKVVCKGVEIPEGFTISGETTSADCRDGAWLLKKRTTVRMMSDDSENPSAASPGSSAIQTFPMPAAAADRTARPAAGAAWKTFSPLGQQFSILMPGEPVASNVAGQETSKAYAVMLDNVLFIVVSAPHPARTEDKSFRKQMAKVVAVGYRLGFLEELKARDPNVDLVLDRELEIDGTPGVQYRIVSTRLHGLARIFSGSNHDYVLQTIGTTEDDQKTAKFLDSFKILN